MRSETRSWSRDTTVCCSYDGQFRGGGGGGTISNSYKNISKYFVLIKMMPNS